MRGENIAKGMKMVLEERGISTIRKNASWMRETLAVHPDFRDEKCLVAHLLVNKGHIPMFLPKFHLEMNPIERVWAHLKRYTRAHCNYSLQSLRKNIPLSYDSVTLENIHNHFRKVKHYMFGYLEGVCTWFKEVQSGSEIESMNEPRPLLTDSSFPIRVKF